MRASDPDADDLTFTLEGAPDGLTIDAAGVIDWTPAANQTGPHSFTVTADDARGGVTGRTFTLSVASQAVNAAPQFYTQPDRTTPAGVIYTYAADAHDTEGDTLRYRVESGPAGLFVIPTTGLVQWLPTAAAAGSHDVTLSVSDGRGGVDRQSFTLTVGAANQPPTIDSDAPAFAYVGRIFKRAAGILRSLAEETVRWGWRHAPMNLLG